MSNNYKEKIEKILDTADSSEKFDKKDIENGKGMAILSYILPFIPYFLEKENKYVRYHARQGMDLLLISIIYSILNSVLISLIKVNGACSFFGYNLGHYCKVTPWWVTLPLTIIGIGISIIALIGILNAIKGKAKELPIVNKFKIFK